MYSGTGGFAHHKTQFSSSRKVLFYLQLIDLDNWTAITSKACQNGFLQIRLS
jgi:hypothetical protein